MGEAGSRLLESGRLKEVVLGLLKRYGIRPKKSLGQMFVVSRRVLDDYARIASETGERMFMEIGTGLGLLTLSVVARTGATVVTIEKDPRLYTVANEILGGLENVVLVLGDGLELLRRTRIGALFSSTPYDLSSQIILAAARNNSVRLALLGVQKELGLRAVSEPGSPDYGRLSVITQLIFDAKLVSVYPPSAFLPRPRVSGALILLERKKPYDPRVHALVERLTACAFSQRNRLAQRVLRECARSMGAGEVSEGMLSTIGVSGDQRVRDVPPFVFERLAEELLS